MYKVFFKNKEINLINRTQVFYSDRKTTFIDFDIVEKIHQKVMDFLKSKAYYHLVIFSEDLPQLKNDFFNLFSQITAAGGVVFNSEKEILMIKKRGSWDFPKGKTEEGEDLEVTAIREIKEETGINALIINSTPYKTYHIYTEKDELMIKTTYWYKMEQGKKSKPKPEEKEGIEKVRWVSKEKAIRRIENSFLGLRYLLTDMLR
ncbi:MAG: hypothetical protein CSA94_01490 [Bacteroidetes bacterium]|nr:MAG: hypothetical protein CSA94_01490 [Bacteroidota bacterium]